MQKIILILASIYSLYAANLYIVNDKDQVDLINQDRGDFALIKYGSSYVRHVSDGVNFLAIEDRTPSYLQSCKEILDDGRSIGDGIYTIKANNKIFQVYCDMTTQGGGWTLIIMSREEIGYANSENAKQITTNPNYNNWDNKSYNEDKILDPTQNTLYNVVTRAIESVKFKDILFKCVGSCPADKMSIYRHNKTSLYADKNGTLDKISSTTWPFNLTAMYEEDKSTYVSTDTIHIDSCAPDTSRGYYACSKLGISGIDYYSFQNTTGIATKAKEWHSETNEMNVLLGTMKHRGFQILSGDIYVRE